MFFVCVLVLGVVVPEKKSKEKPTRKSKRRSSEVERDVVVVRDKRIKTEDATSQLVSQET